LGYFGCIQTAAKDIARWWSG